MICKKLVTRYSVRRIILDRRQDQESAAQGLP
jgi:hypothetical protein